MTHRQKVKIAGITDRAGKATDYSITGKEAIWHFVGYDKAMAFELLDCDGYVITTYVRKFEYVENDFLYIVTTEDRIYYLEV